MSRNGSGTYSLPTGNPVVTGTTIETSWANNTLSDIATALTDSLSRSGQGGMTAAFRGADGTSGLPGISFTNETTTGLYRAGSADLRLAVTTSVIQQWLATGTSITGTMTISGNTTLSALTASKVVFTDASKVLTSTGTVGIDQGGTGGTTASAARTNLGGTTVGANFFTLTNPSAITFPRINADNSVSALDAATFRTAIGAGGGDVTAASANAFTGANTFYNTTGQTFGTGTSTQDGIIIAGRAGGSASYRVTLAPGTLTASRAVTFPDAAGAIVLDGATQTLTNKTLGSGSVLGAAVTGGDFAVTRVMLQDNGYVYFNSGTTNALDYVNGSHQRWAPNTGSQTLSITNWPPSGNLGELLIEGVNLGAATITWPTINWIKSDGTTTTTFSSNGVTLQTSGTDWVVLWTRDAGTTIYGKIIR